MKDRRLFGVKQFSLLCVNRFTSELLMKYSRQQRTQIRIVSDGCFGITALRRRWSTDMIPLDPIRRESIPEDPGVRHLLMIQNITKARAFVNEADQILEQNRHIDLIDALDLLIKAVDAYEVAIVFADHQKDIAELNRRSVALYNRSFQIRRSVRSDIFRLEASGFSMNEGYQCVKDGLHSLRQQMFEPAKRFFLKGITYLLHSIIYERLNPRVEYSLNIVVDMAKAHLEQLQSSTKEATPGTGTDMVEIELGIDPLQDEEENKIVSSMSEFPAMYLCTVELGEASYEDPSPQWYEVKIKSGDRVRVRIHEYPSCTFRMRPSRLQCSDCNYDTEPLTRYLYRMWRERQSQKVKIRYCKHCSVKPNNFSTYEYMNVLVNTL